MITPNLPNQNIGLAMNPLANPLSNPTVKPKLKKNNKKISLIESQNQKIWSNLEEIGEILQVPLSQKLFHEKEHFQHLNFHAGQRIFTLSQKFEALYLVHSGFLKSVLFDEFGNEQILSFPMRGDILGTDSIHAEHHNSESIALTDCNIIILPYKKLIQICHNYTPVEAAIFGVISKELAQQQVRISMLGKTSAEARVSQFLVILAERYNTLGYSQNTFVLRMTRSEIGSYLGITLETVSRILSSLNELGVVTVHQKEIGITNLQALRNLYTLSRTHN